MGIFIMILQLIVSLSILVVFHEMGHFLPAKWFKTKVEKFYLFFNPKFSLFKKQIGETEYGIGWIPLGGYVKIAGMVDESMDKEQMAKPPEPWEFRSKPAWQRLIIMIGGVTVNLILGFLIFCMMLFVWGDKFIPNDNIKYGIFPDELGQEIGLQEGDKILKVGQEDFLRFNPGKFREAVVFKDVRDVTIERAGSPINLKISDDQAKRCVKNSVFGPQTPVYVEQLQAGPARDAGMLPGDRIIGIDGQSTPFYHQFKKLLNDRMGQSITVAALRDRDTMYFDMVTTEKGLLKFGLRSGEDIFGFERNDYGFAESIPAGIKKGNDFLMNYFNSFAKMFNGDISPNDSLGGFISITKLFPQTWQWEEFWRITALLSFILGIMNLLPIPGLDGGYVMFLFWEVITGKKLSEKFMERAITVGFILLLALLIYANGLDILRLFK